MKTLTSLLGKSLMASYCIPCQQTLISYESAFRNRFLLFNYLIFITQIQSGVLTMKRLAKLSTLLAGALVAALTLSACGGADPADTVAPTVEMTDSVTDATATGPVTFTFTFSEEVKGFTAEDVTVTGGDKAATVTAGSTNKVYTLVVTPTANTTGTISVSIDQGKFTDVSNNPNAVVPAVTQAYNTVTVKVSGSTGTCTSAPCLNFSETTLSLEGFEGLVSAEVANDPVDSTNKVGKLVKASSGNDWAGATVMTKASDKSVSQIDLSVSKVITMRVYAPAAGEKIRLVLESTVDAAKIEADALTTKANEWETLSFNFGPPTAGTYSSSATYNKVSIFPAFLAKVDKTYYFDEIKYTAKPVTEQPSGVTPIVFASGYTAIDASTVGYAYQGTSTQGGAFNWTVANGATFGWGGADFWWSGVASNDATPNFYWGGKGKADQDYMESWVNAPTNSTLSLTGQSKLRIVVWGNDQLVGQPRFTPAIQLAANGTCYPRAEAAPLTPTSIGADNATYNIALASFTVVENCGTAMTITEFMAKPIGSIRVRIYKANYNTAGDAPNGINLGPISFQP